MCPPGFSTPGAAHSPPHVLTVLRFIFVGRAELLDDLLLLGLHHGRVALSQLAEESWRLSVVSWGLGPHPAKQKTIGNLCNVQFTKSYLERLLRISPGAPEILRISNLSPYPCPKCTEPSWKACTNGWQTGK